MNPAGSPAKGYPDMQSTGHRIGSNPQEIRGAKYSPSEIVFYLSHGVNL